MGLGPMSWSLVISRRTPLPGTTPLSILMGASERGSQTKPLFCTLPQELSSCSRRPCQSSKTKRPPGKHRREWNVPGFSKRFYRPQVEEAAGFTQAPHRLI